MDILDVGMKLIGEEFFGLSPNRMEMWKKGQFVESVIRTRELVDKTPSMFVFYVTWRRKEGDIQKKLIELENRYCSKLQKEFPAITRNHAECILAILLGLTTAPHLDLEKNKAVIEMIFKTARTKN